MRVKYGRAAFAELNDAVKYYDQKRTGLGDEFRAEVADAEARILQNPEACAPIVPDAGVRQCLTHVFPYGLVYRVRRDVILIVAVAHLRRKQGYWMKRL